MNTKELADASIGALRLADIVHARSAAIDRRDDKPLLDELEMLYYIALANYRLAMYPPPWPHDRNPWDPPTKRV